MNRELLKKAIKKLVLQEITNNQFGTPIHTDKKDIDGEKALTSALGKDAHVAKARGTGKTIGVKGNQTVELGKNCDHCYDVVSVTNESERKIARGVSLEDAMELVKQHAESSEKTYVQKAYDKSLRGFGKKPAEAEEAEEADEMDDADEETQLDIADDTTKKADVKADKKTAPINKDVAHALGGNIVDKLEKIIDKVLKDKTKADAKSAYLKHDKDTESPDKLSVKLKDTPALKEKKS
jgi:hypothetical protein